MMAHSTPQKKAPVRLYYVDTGSDFAPNALKFLLATGRLTGLETKVHKVNVLTDLYDVFTDSSLVNGRKQSDALTPIQVHVDKNQSGQFNYQLMACQFPPGLLGPDEVANQLVLSVQCPALETNIKNRYKDADLLTNKETLGLANDIRSHKELLKSIEQLIEYTDRNKSATLESLSELNEHVREVVQIIEGTMADIPQKHWPVLSKLIAGAHKRISRELCGLETQMDHIFSAVTTAYAEEIARILDDAIRLHGLRGRNGKETATYAKMNEWTPEHRIRVEDFTAVCEMVAERINQMREQIFSQ